MNPESGATIRAVIVYDLKDVANNLNSTFIPVFLKPVLEDNQVIVEEQWNLTFWESELQLRIDNKDFLEKIAKGPDSESRIEKKLTSIADEAIASFKAHITTPQKTISNLLLDLLLLEKVVADQRKTIECQKAKLEELEQRVSKFRKCR